MPEREHKYHNPDLRCTHPPAAGCDYCWTYAHHVDGTKGYEDLVKRCSAMPCEFWKPSKTKDQ